MTVAALRGGFTRFHDAAPARLHAAAHSHHPWPDVTEAAQRAAWEDAIRRADHKWSNVFDVVLPETASWMARRLGLPDPTTIAVAPNTHELVMRILSCLDPPVRILTTDGEFTSFERQVRRLAEEDLVEVHRVPVEPAETLAVRLADAASVATHDLLFFSHVIFGTGAVVDPATVIAGVADDDSFVVIDGYHGFMALPTDLRTMADRAFYLAGGYKYAMAGEGVCFAHCPPGYGLRPRDTGWFADFAALTDDRGPVDYGPGGQRFLGATFDPTPLYRFNAVQRWLDAAGVTVRDIHQHVHRLQHRFLDAVQGCDTVLGAGAPVHAPSAPGRHGNLLAFAVPDAADVADVLARRDVVVDHRGPLVRFGFGVYHDDADIDALVDRCERALRG
jgi:kynureninase